MIRYGHGFIFPDAWAYGEPPDDDRPVRARRISPRRRAPATETRAEPETVEKNQKGRPEEGR